MPVDIFWYLPKRVLMVQLEGHTRFDEQRQLGEQVTAFLDEGEPPMVHILVNTESAYDQMVQISYAQQVLTFIKHEQLGWLLPYGPTKRIRHFAASVLTQAAGVRYRYCKSLDDALDFLQQADPTLPELPR